jgi:phosphoglycolate phosphatase-like HAD superfamily hydrolase
MANKSKLILWDIDGTLIRGARQAVVAFHAALRRVYELPPTIARISYGGKTDAQIVRETMLLHALDHPEITSRIPAFQAAYLDEWQHIAERLRAEVEVLPGVRAALQRLAPHATNSLLTGNFVATARLKLEAADLSGWFDWSCGAFGSDHEQRNELVPIALQRARDAGMQVDAEHVVVVGDTPNDIACARAGGVRVLAVATGTFDRATLASHAPDALLDNLSDTEAVWRAIWG